MHLKPAHLDELKYLVACAHERGEKISSVDLAAFNRVLEHKAEDMTAAVEAGLTLSAFQAKLRERSQWLPIDPDAPETLTIADLLSRNASGPRRFGYGTIGDYLIGMKAVLADGTLIAPGGKVVKNVAGYDLAKLFVGGQGTLGIIVEATFKLRPIPETEQFIEQSFQSVEALRPSVEGILDSELTPIVFDLHNLSADSRYRIVLGFAGTKEEVEWQLEKARALGVGVAGSLDHNQRFWEEKTVPKKLSVLPSRIVDALPQLNHAPFVARAGNGIIFHRCDVGPQKSDLPLELFRRLKIEFDPKQIFPELKW
jgi:FAD/FMN-containing dehydrogenase